MSRRQEKRRKFNEAVINMLFPPPPPPQAKDEDLTVNNCDRVFDANLAPDDFGEGGSSSSSSDNGGSGEDPKLTRAQRKRLRQKKLKTDASRRGKIIGPLLPPTEDDYNGGNAKNLALENCSPTVRHNAAEEPPPVTDQPDEPVLCSGEPPTCAKYQSKIKQRRLAKKLARKNLLAPSEENCSQDQNIKSSKGSDGKDCAKNL